MTSPKLTLVGIQPPADDAHPIPLVRYAAVHEYTPSHARPARSCWDDYQPTPVFIPPARRTPRPQPMPPVPAALTPPEPRRRAHDQVIAGLLVCYATALVMVLWALLGRR